MKQNTLDIELPYQQSLDNFVAGENTELVAMLNSLAEVTPPFKGIWISGDKASGKSHLLRATASACSHSGEHCDYVGLADGGRADVRNAQISSAAQLGRFVVIDDVDRIVGNEHAEAALMSLYERVFDAGGGFVVTHLEAATNLRFELADLASRMRGLMHFHLQALADEHKAQILNLRAVHRGFQLSESVVNYWLARGPRDLDALLVDLERLADASLVRKQSITIPLLKDELGY